MIIDDVTQLIKHVVVRLERTLDPTQGRILQIEFKLLNLASK